MYRCIYIQQHIIHNPHLVLITPLFVCYQFISSFSSCVMSITAWWCHWCDFGSETVWIWVWFLAMWAFYPPALSLLSCCCCRKSLCENPVCRMLKHLSICRETERTSWQLCTHTGSGSASEVVGVLNYTKSIFLWTFSAQQSLLHRCVSCCVSLFGSCRNKVMEKVSRSLPTSVRSLQ